MGTTVHSDIVILNSTAKFPFSRLKLDLIAIRSSVRTVLQHDLDTSHLALDDMEAEASEISAKVTAS